MRLRFFSLLFILLLFSLPALSDQLLPEEMASAMDAAPFEEQDALVSPVPVNPAREALIDGIIKSANTLYRRAHGKPQRAQYANDIYVCKNFTTYVFAENAQGFALAQYPDVPLSVPANKKKDDCAPYAYGVEWRDIPAEEGNPFYEAARFRYDASLSKAENEALARAFMQQAHRGDYFQMSADYYYGKGAHSMFFIADYDPQTDTVRWADSNMKGETVGGERYGYVQFDAVKEIGWFVDAFCHKTRGATIYRLRDDIIFREN